MADLLTHVLVVYAVLMVARWRLAWVERRWIVVAMGGAAIPDLVKIHLVVKSHTVERLLGVPFHYGAMSTIGGVVLVSTAITLAFKRRYWRPVYAALVFGGVTSLIGDGLRMFADGKSTPWLYPLTMWRPPTPNLYVTSDYRVTAAVLLVAVSVWVADTYLDPGQRAEADEVTQAE